jgi:hypothetical protein
MTRRHTKQIERQRGLSFLTTFWWFGIALVSTFFLWVLAMIFAELLTHWYT